MGIGTMRVAYTIYSLRRTYAYLCLTRTKRKRSAQIITSMFGTSVAS